MGEIVVKQDLAEVPSIRLGPGQSLKGSNAATLCFSARVDGVQLSADNAIEGLTLATDPDRRAIYNDTSFAGFGRVDLKHLRVAGCVRVLAEEEAMAGHVSALDVLIEEADATACEMRPSGYGVEVIPGAFMLWNRQADPASLVTADLHGVGVGRPGQPVRGGGIFVGGTPGGGRTLVTRLVTDEVHSHGGITAGTADRIAGGVFVVSGTHAHVVHNRGSVTTYGPNDMVLDNWGSVDNWRADSRITSLGPSAIGFVNFGDLSSLVVEAPIETFGAGARGFNVYDGTLGEAIFDRVVTRGDGAVGIQISRPVGRFLVKRGIETFGGTGDSLVKGVMTRLAAVPLSIKPGGAAKEIEVHGGVTSHGEGVPPFEHHGQVERLLIEGGFTATGGGFAAI
ncbi:hypothetical protein [Lichenicoccus sp.]|uniref:hypothetical protein n=1 Tax=Lichenicoccus sp. TaxID=2781899 RepID=UPI003D11DBA9